MSKKEIVGYSELRMIFNHFQIHEDIVDLMLIKFAENDISSHVFLNKLESFVKMNSFLNEPKKMTKEEVEEIGKTMF